jgi:hypothetical protein
VGEMILNLKIPPDSTFLSQIIYEGIIYALQSNHGASFSLNEVNLSNDFLKRAYGNMNDEIISEISIKFTGNDKVNKIIEKLGIRKKIPKKNYRELLKILREIHQNISINRNNIVLQTKIGNKDIFLDTPENSDLVAPQLFKIDRYTGISTMEMGLISEQLTLKASLEVILIGLMGIYSSYITTVRQQKNTYYYFVFMSPEEIISLLSSGDRYKLINVYSIKELLRDILSVTLKSSIVGEIAILEVILNTKIRSELESKSLDKVNFVVFKISPEGQTYKIYETIPITVYRRPMFYEVLSSMHVKNADKVCEVLYEALSPDGVVMKTLESFNFKNKYDECEIILRGVLGLYRFVSLSDAQGLFQFLRSLEDACSIIKNNEKARYRIYEYANIQKELSYAL